VKLSQDFIKCVRRILRESDWFNASTGMRIVLSPILFNAMTKGSVYSNIVREKSRR
jgi:hypothetical protein